MNSKTTNVDRAPVASVNQIIGRYCFSVYQFYDVKAKKHRFKKRPMLIIGMEKEHLPCDLTVLPISKIQIQVHKHDDYDIEISNSEYPLCQLNFDPSYIRVHKVATINSKDLIPNSVECDLANEYPVLFEKVKDKFKQFTNDLF